MLFTSLVSLILSNAVATMKTISISYSRVSFVTYFFSMLFVYSLFDYYFLGLLSVGLYNGLIYNQVSILVIVLFIFILALIIKLLTSFYPYEKFEGKYDINSMVNEMLMNPSQDLMKSEISQESSWENIPGKTAVKYSNIQETNNRIVEKLNINDYTQADREHYRIIEYPLITLFIILGGIMLLSSNDLITIFLSIELQSYGLYILSTIYRDSESSTGAGLTYFLLGGLSSCIILLGLSFLYINSGTTSLDGLYTIHNIITSDNNLLSYFIFEQSNSTFNTDSLYKEGILNSIFSLNYYQYTLQFSFVILSVGFLFKIAAAPFHSWSPGVYDSIPTVTTTFVAIIPKISILILFFDLVYYTWYTTFDYSWTNVLLFSSFLSLIIGSILGLTQFRIKRLYAYSTISHVGFILLALCVHSVESIQAFFFYIIQYSLSNLNAFLILIVIGYSYVNYSKKTEAYESNSDLYSAFREKLKNLSPIEYIDDIKGYFYLNPLLAISLSITLYSFIGVPPLVGFFGKQMVLSSALDNGYIFMCLIAILTSVISAVYYLYIIKHLFFEKSVYRLNRLKNLLIINELNEKNKNYTLILSSWLTCTISILSLVILLFFFLYFEIYFLMNIISILIVY
jgi:NADH-ubiquinone oxidoreductase chain 2